MPLAIDVSGDAPPETIPKLVEVLSSAFGVIPGGPSGEWSCSVWVAAPEEISELHLRYFGDPSDTDVMSFPSGDPLDAGSGYLGDIAVSARMAAIQAAEHDHPVDREITFLALHGLLHLVGYDDSTEEERNAMLKVQHELLSVTESKLGIQW